MSVIPGKKTWDMTHGLLESRSGAFSEILHQIAKKEADEATSGKPCEPGRAVIV